MTIQNNSRQVPKKIETTSDINYYDILYVHLQVISERDENTNVRYLKGARLNFSELGRALGLSRQTAKRKFDGLKELKLVAFNETLQRWELPQLQPKDAFLVPQSTLRKIVTGLSKNAVSIYVYLLNRYYANKGQEFQFTLNALKSYCGISTKTTSNNYMITDILEILSLIGLIECERRTARDEGGQITTHYYLKSASVTLSSEGAKIDISPAAIKNKEC